MKEIDRLRPATIVDTRRVITIAAPYHRRADLSARVRRGTMRGHLRPLDAAPYWNANIGLWQQRVVQLRPEPPAWRKPVLVACGVLVVLATLFGLAWWLLATLAALPLGALCLAALAALFLLTRMNRTQNVTIIQNVRIR